jgi:(p)ppGpp synthase/HD superfamily hydrolase
MSKVLGIEFEKGVRFLAKYMPVSEENSRKPILFHDIRVGTYLYEKGYAQNIVLAGLLHDVIEWSTADEKILKEEFGEDIFKLVMANTKNDSIADGEDKINELIKRCAENGQEALIVKSADIIDSFKWYSSQNNKNELQYCMRTANAIFKLKPDNFNDKIFEELRIWQKND